MEICSGILTLDSWQCSTKPNVHHQVEINSLWTVLQTDIQSLVLLPGPFKLILLHFCFLWGGDIGNFLPVPVPNFGTKAPMWTSGPFNVQLDANILMYQLLRCQDSGMHESFMIWNSILFWKLTFHRDLGILCSSKLEFNISISSPLIGVK